ncbi:MAG TPA: DUF5985 family protein [Rudaea sp.]|jgi:hypothetical protein
MINFLLGAIAMAAATAGLIFLRYYQRTHDRFFLLFAASFGLEALGRVLSVCFEAFDDSSGAVFILRLVSYLLILVAIFLKNLPARRR